jgi:hypothetical protein
MLKTQPMKKSNLTLISLFFLFIISEILSTGFVNTHDVVQSVPRQGVAVIMTGAAARIPQETALLEELDKKRSSEKSGLHFRC